MSLLLGRPPGLPDCPGFHFAASISGVSLALRLIGGVFSGTMHQFWRQAHVGKALEGDSDVLGFDLHRSAYSPGQFSGTQLRTAARKWFIANISDFSIEI